MGLDYLSMRQNSRSDGLTVSKISRQCFSLASLSGGGGSQAYRGPGGGSRAPAIINKKQFS